MTAVVFRVGWTRSLVIVPNRAARSGRRGRCRRRRVGPSTTDAFDGVRCSVFLNNRYYDPSVGVFLSVDPLVSKTGAPYLYASGNPTTLSDPTGLEPAPCELDDSCVGGGNTIERRLRAAIGDADRRFGPKPADWCGRIACPDWGATYPESESPSDFINLFDIGPLDAIRLLACGHDQNCQIGVLKGSRSDITGASTDAIDDVVLDEVLVWAGAQSYEPCGTSGSGVSLYCVGVSRLPTMKSGPDAMTLGHFILYDITEPNTDYLQPDGSYSLALSDPKLLAHELGHVPQWEQFGSDFMWLYLRSPNNWECLANSATGTTAGTC